MASCGSPAKRAAREEEGKGAKCSFLAKPQARRENGTERISPDDEGVYRFRRGYGGGISGRRRLTAIKWALYKLNNNDTVAYAA